MNTTSKPQPVLIAFSILVGLDILTAGAAFADLVGAETVALIVLILAAIKAGAAFYLRGVVTPYSNVVAYQPNTDRPSLVLAGGATTIEGTSLSTDSPVMLERLTK